MGLNAGRAAVTRVVAALLCDRGRLCAARRPLHKRQGGLWELPGGKVDPGESDHDALRRELREELGVAVDVGESFATSLHEYDFGAIELHVYRCTCEGEPRAIEHEELRWLGPEEVTDVEWAPADVPVVESWAAEPRA